MTNPNTGAPSGLVQELPEQAGFRPEDTHSTEAAEALHKDKAQRRLALVPLEQETRAGLTTAEAALHLNRQQQTLRIWASRGNGPIQPRRINGRLLWPVDEMRAVLGV